MYTSTDLFILVNIFVLVQCEIPNLNVRKTDRQLIARKRQDTLDMCRIFTEENAKIQQTKPKIIESYKNIQRTHKRHKRDASPALEAEFLEHGTLEKRGHPVLKPENARRHKRDVHATGQTIDSIKKEKTDGGNKYAVNPALSPADVQKIESIVEKMYDDMEEKGQKVLFRRNPAVTTSTTTTTMNPKNASGKSPSRRLYFGPKLLTGPGLKGREQRPRNETFFYEKARWKHGIIPYFIDSKTYDTQLQDVIMKAFDYIEKATCIRLQKLRERPTDKKSLQEVDWVYISNPSGVRQCVHSNEKRKIDGVQMSVLGYDCMSLGDIVHEVMHILGFSHEHARSDRDQHITIVWDNIKPGYMKYFEIAKAADQYTLENLPYDYASILHYPPRAFSKNGQITIITEPGVKIGQREGLSEIDLEKVGSIYASECVERNKDYLLKTCPNVVRSQTEPPQVAQKDIDDYFKERLWPFGLISYKLRDKMEFSIEERENIKAVIDHIEKETCIQFRDISATADDHEEEEESTDKRVPENHNFNPDDPSVRPPENIPTNIDDKKTPLEESLRNNAENEINNIDDRRDPPIGNEGTIAATRFRRQVKSLPSSQRRHANSVLVLTRTAVPGCKCPQPGKPSGNAVLEINADCFNSVNDLLHLFVHVLGLDHQHNMYDRDNYLHILWDNLTPEVENDLKERLPPAASVGFPYDYQSVMHYPWLQIKNGVTNMMYPIWNDGWAMGHWQGLSSFDVQKLNLLYFSQCSERQKQLHN